MGFLRFKPAAHAAFRQVFVGSIDGLHEFAVLGIRGVHQPRLAGEGLEGHQQEHLALCGPLDQVADDGSLLLRLLRLQ
jgi:hypothetical protein